MPKISVKVLAFTVLAFIFAFIQGGNLPYRIFYGLFVTFIVNILYILLKQKNIAVSTKFERRVYYAGENTDFSVIIKNEGLFPLPYLMIKNKTLSNIDKKYKGIGISLRMDETKYIKKNVRFTQRGSYDFGENLVIINDLFYIFEKTKRFNETLNIKVYPRIYDIQKFITKGNDIFKNSLSTKTNIEDSYSIKDVRKYNEGDSLKRVIWKVSAKHGELYVRNFDTVSGEESNLFLDMNKENMIIDGSSLLEEVLVDFTVSIINTMQDKRIKSNLFVNCLNPRKFSIDSKEDFNELMEFFLNQKSDGENSFVRFLNSNIMKMPKLSWIGLITARVDDNLKDTLIYIRDRGYNVTLFYYANTLDRLNNIEFLKKIGVQCLSINEMINKVGS